MFLPIYIHIDRQTNKIICVLGRWVCLLCFSPKKVPTCSPALLTVTQLSNTVDCFESVFELLIPYVLEKSYEQTLGIFSGEGRSVGMKVIFYISYTD